MTTFGYEYREDFPYNIEAPQKLYIQYSHDIDFVYTGDNYPLGEEHEGFLWEPVYNPVEHMVDDVLVGRHVWMRISIGDSAEWTLPMRITDSFTNIESTEGIVNETTNEVTFTLKYTLDTGEVIESEPITLKNGDDGVGITNTAIVNDNLVITYSDGTIDDLGRVTGYDGTGVPFGSPDDYYLTNQSNVPTWIAPTDILNTNLTATSPLVFSNPNFSHLDTDGNRHVASGGTAGDSLITTDGAGTYSWAAHILLADLDDTAGSGDTDKLYSADHITGLIAGLSLFGIKYSETTKVLLDLITGVDDELGVVTNDPLWPYRTVFKWSGGGGGNWGTGFFDLDALHDHNTLYTLTTDLEGDGLSSVHWNNITNAPTFMETWNALSDSGNVDIGEGEILSILGDSGVSTGISGNTLTITGTTYTAGVGLDLTTTEFSHEDTSSLNSINYTGGIVLQGVTVDTFGHLQGLNTVNLDSRYSGIAHTHPNIVMTQTIDLGNWDMVADVNHNINISGLGIDSDDVIDVTVWVVDNSGTGHARNLMGPLYANNTTVGGIILIPEVTSNFIFFNRTTSGQFNDPLYGGSATNRGWVTITHI